MKHLYLQAVSFALCIVLLAGCSLPIFVPLNKTPPPSTMSHQEEQTSPAHEKEQEILSSKTTTTLQSPTPEIILKKENSPAPTDEPDTSVQIETEQNPQITLPKTSLLLPQWTPVDVDIFHSFEDFTSPQLFFTDKNTPLFVSGVQTPSPQIIAGYFKDSSWYGLDDTPNKLTRLPLRGRGIIKNIDYVIDTDNAPHLTWEQDGKIWYTQWNKDKKRWTHRDQTPGYEQVSSEVHNNSPRIVLDKENDPLIAWIFNHTENIPENFHTQSLSHHDLYITRWKDDEWQKMNGTYGISSISGTFPSPISVAQFTLLLKDENPFITWTALPQDLGFEYGNSLFISQWNGETWQDPQKPAQSFATLSEKKVFLHSPQVFQNEDNLHLGWQGQSMNRDETFADGNYRPSFYTWKNEEWQDISPAHLPYGNVHQYQITSDPQGNPLLIESEDLYSLKIRSFRDNQWSQINNHINLSPYQTLVPKPEESKGTFLLGQKDTLYQLSTETGLRIEKIVYTKEATE